MPPQRSHAHPAGVSRHRKVFSLLALCAATGAFALILLAITGGQPIYAVKPTTIAEQLPKSRSAITSTNGLPPIVRATEVPATESLVELAPPAIPNYTPTFSEIECPFVKPWSQEILCGTLTVPEVRIRADSPQIALFVAILKSQGPPQTDPIFVLPGGPGGAISSGRDLFYSIPSHRNRDIVLLDPRGTGLSFPSLDCYELDDVGMQYADNIEATRVCHERLVGEGRDLSGYVTAEQVQDVADLAKALGYGKINLYATSYGTRVAALLADRFPALVRSMVLDGVLPVTVNSLLEEPLNIYGVFERVTQDCAADPRCNGNYPAIEPRLLEIIDRYNKNPLPGDIGYGTGNDILKFIFKRLYSGGAKIPAFITALFDEDFARACALMPPDVGCFFTQESGGVWMPVQGAAAMPTLETLAGIDLHTPEVDVSPLITWESIARTYGDALYVTPVATDGEGNANGASSLATVTASVEAPWRRHFARPEDPISPDLEKISWLMHDLGYARPQQLFDFLETQSEDQVEALLHAIPQPVADSLSEGVYASVMCAEEAPFFTLADIAELAARIPDQFGSLPTRRAQEIEQICDFWQVPPISAARKLVLPSAVPTLITNGTHDPITPAVWAERAAIYMDAAWVRLFPGYGHSILSTGDACMKQMVDIFYTNPEQEPLPTCFTEIQLEFDTPE